MSDQLTIVMTNESGEAEHETLRQRAKALGVTPHTTKIYTVGDYRYTQLADGIAQAGRVARFEST